MGVIGCCMAQEKATTDAAQNETGMMLPDTETVPDTCPDCGRDYLKTKVVDARSNGGWLFRKFDHEDEIIMSDYCVVKIQGGGPEDNDD